MPFEIRAVELDELDELELADQRGFGMAPMKPEVSRSWATAELDRTRVAFEAGRMVGVSRTYSFELTMPGGAFVPAAAVSWVSVVPTHRRRGVLTQMMDAMHDDARARGEPVAMLTASESSIYGRFGYGVATWRLGITAARARIAFARPDVDDGRMRILTREESERELPALYEQARRARAGMVSRPDFWWPQVFYGFLFDKSKACFAAVHTDAHGHDDGYVAYEISDDWAGGLPDRRLSIFDMQAETPTALAALWRYVFGVDLIATVAASNLPIDDPLRHMVVDARHVRVDYVNDNLWIAPLDPVALLAARTYTVPGRVVLEVHAPDGAKKTLAVEVGADGTSCAITTDRPDLVCSSAVLAMCVLGGNRWSELAAAGRLEATGPEVLALADAMFLATPAPALLSYF
jgi:predicted acetyltransferase